MKDTLKEVAEIGKKVVVKVAITGAASAALGYLTLKVRDGGKDVIEGVTQIKNIVGSAIKEK